MAGTYVITWQDYFMGVAFLAAKRSKDPATKVGACIVNEDNRIIGCGYNGMPIGCPDEEMIWTKGDKDPLKTKYPYVCHAEMNAIVYRNNVDVKGCTMYVGLFPCNECAKIIIQSGIKKIYYISDKYANEPTFQASKPMFQKAGIEFEQYRPKTSKIEIDFGSLN